MTDGWRIRRLTDLVKLGNGYPFPSASFGPAGHTPLVRIRDLYADEFEMYVSGDVPAASLIRNGDVIIGMDGDFNVVTWSRGDAALNQRLCRLRPREDADMRFIAYALPPVLRRLNDLTFATTVKHLSSADILRERLLVPPPDEQRRIADFLDAETARAGALIEARTRQAGLLEQLRTARIHDVLTGGSVPGPRKRAGIGWLGTIPATWPVASVAARFEVRLGKMLSPDHATGGYLRPYLRNANVQWGRVDTDDLRLMNFPPAERQRYRIHSGDLLVCEGGEPGRAALWNGDNEVYYQKALHRARARGADDPRWLYYCLRLASFMRVFAEGNVTTIAHLTGEQLGAQRFPFPAPDVQRDAADALDRSEARITALLAAIAAQQDLIAKRRDAVIYAAVTGAMDIP